MISVICVVKNGLPYLENSIKSFLLQDLKNKELIIVYSKSNDGTENVLEEFKNEKNINILYDTQSINKFHSINKGIDIARGEIIGLLHSDDVFYSSKTLSTAYKFINSNKIDGIYGNILIVKRNNPTKVKRVWTDKYFSDKSLNDGWMPAHTSLFLKRKIILELNKYSTRYIISSDYEFILKLFKKKKYKIKYLNKFMVIMRDGGDSAVKLFNKLKEDYSILKKYNLGIYTLFLKSYAKIYQYINLHKIFLNNYLRKVLYQELSLANKAKINSNKYPKIFIALNLATSLYLIKKKISFNSLVFWKDGLMSKFWDYNNKDKILPGRDFLKNLDLNKKKIDKIYIIGNISNKLKLYFKKTVLNKKISYIKLPFFNINQLKSVANKIKIIKKSLIILNISSPKQEFIAEQLFLKHRASIYCLGAATLMLSGVEKIPPSFFTIFKIEFLWRLRKNFIFRIIRIIKSAYVLFYYHRKINSNFILKKIN